MANPELFHNNFHEWLKSNGVRFLWGSYECSIDHTELMKGIYEILNIENQKCFSETVD